MNIEKKLYVRSYREARVIFLLAQFWCKLISTYSACYRFNSLALSYPHFSEQGHVHVHAVWPGSLMCSIADKGPSQPRIMSLWWFLIDDSKLFLTDLMYGHKSSVALRLSLSRNLLTSASWKSWPGCHRLQLTPRGSCRLCWSHPSAFSRLISWSDFRCSS